MSHRGCSAVDQLLKTLSGLSTVSLSRVLKTQPPAAFTAVGATCRKADVVDWEKLVSHTSHVNCSFVLKLYTQPKKGLFFKVHFNMFFIFLDGISGDFCFL